MPEGAGREIAIAQGRVWAKTVFEALDKIFDKHPGAEVSIEAVQKRSDGYWWEYTAQLKGEERDGEM
jgi:hypothetical protein